MTLVKDIMIFVYNINAKLIAQIGACEVASDMAFCQKLVA
jgi:hypothetical protein